MNAPHRIILCGMSIFIAAIESGLHGKAMGEVLAFNPLFPDVLARIRSLDPSLVIMDKAGYQEDLARSLLEQSIPIIILDESQRKITVVSGKCLEDIQYLEAGMTELIQTIEEILPANQTVKIGVGK